MNNQINLSLGTHVAQPSPGICDAIKHRLALSEPCTLEELMDAVTDDCGIGVEHLLPVTILAIAALITSEEICQYIDRQPLDEPLDYSWVLSEEAAIEKRDRALSGN